MYKYMKEKKSVDVKKRRQTWSMFCLSVVDMKGVEVIGKGFYRSRKGEWVGKYFGIQEGE